MRHLLCVLLVGAVFPMATGAQRPAGEAGPAADASKTPGPRQPASPIAPTVSPSGALPAAPNDADAALFASPTRLDHIGRIVVRVTINGRGPFRFIVDTGANRSTVTPALVRKLGLPPEPSMQLSGVTGTAQVPAVRIRELQAGDLKIQNTEFPVVWAPLMAGTDGFLGAAGLTAQRLLVDFQHNRVVILRAGGRLPGFMRIWGKRVTGGLITVTAVVGGVRVRAVIDTGASRSLGNLALQRALSLRRRRGALSQTTNVLGATSAVARGDLQKSPIIVIGDLRIAGVMLVYGDLNIFKVWNMENKPALIIGMDVLGTADGLAIDFKYPSFFIRAPGIGDNNSFSLEGTSEVSSVRTFDN